MKNMGFEPSAAPAPLAPNINLEAKDPASGRRALVVDRKSGPRS